MAMKTMIIAGILIAGISFYGYAQKTEARAAESFDKIDVFGKVVVDLMKGDKEKVIIESQEVDPGKVTTKVTNKTLKISIAEDIFAAAKSVRVIVTYVQLYEVRSKGGADVRSEVPLKADRIVYEASTGGNIYADVDVKNLEASIGQGSLIYISGKADSQLITANSGGIYSGYGVECKETEVKVSTKAKAKVYAGEILNAQATTGGWIGFQGNPKQKIIKTSLGGKIEATIEDEE